MNRPTTMLVGIAALGTDFLNPLILNPAFYGVPGESPSSPMGSAADASLSLI